MRAGHHTLEPIFSLLLPTEDQTLLLRSALWPPEEARESLLVWQKRFSNPTAAMSRQPGGGKLLAPLICEKVVADAAGLNERLLTYLRTAVLREELRATEYRRICAQVLSAFAAADLPVLLLKGAALAEEVYPRPHVRHSHDIDMLVLEEDLPRAQSILRAIGCQPSDDGYPRDGIHNQYVHRSGLPLSLHTRPFLFQPYNASAEDMWRHSEHRGLLGSTARILSPADQLLHVCVHASTIGNRQNLLWACDAWFVLAYARGIDWDSLMERAVRTSASIPLYVMLDYLSRELRAPIPSSVVSQLASIAGDQDGALFELSLLGAWAGPDLSMVRLLRSAGNWRERAFLFRWRLAPSPKALLWAGRIRTRWHSLPFYLVRLLRFLARRTRASLTGAAPGSGLPTGRHAEPQPSIDS